MKIKEITENNLKITQIGPSGAKLVGQNGLEITLPPEQLSAITQDPSKPGMPQLDLSKADTTQPQAPQPAQQTMGKPAPAAKTDDQSIDTFTSNSQSNSNQSSQSAQPAAPAQPGQQPAANQQQQPELPKVGTEVELPDNIGSTMQSETFDDENDVDLISLKRNKDIGGDAGDDFIKDVTYDRKKHSGRTNRSKQAEVVNESEELIAMLTIAGLR